MDDIRSLACAIPPYAEQRAIADFLHHEAGKIDQMAAKVETAIDRLQEYRTALITAAVIGKINVRGNATREKSSDTPEAARAGGQDIPNTV